MAIGEVMFLAAVAWVKGSPSLPASPSPTPTSSKKE